MVRSIIKIKLGPKFPMTVSLPEKHSIISLQTQGGEPVIWVLVYIDSPDIEVKFTRRGAGDGSGEYEQYVGTWQDHNGAFVWNLFKERIGAKYPIKSYKHED